MASEILTKRHMVEATEVSLVRVTEIVADGSGFVRAVRVYGAPDGSDGPPVFELLLRGADRAAIELKTPELTF